MRTAVIDPTEPLAPPGAIPVTDIAPDGDAAPVPDAQDPPDNANQAPGDEGPGEPAAGDDDQAPAAGEDDRMGEAGSGAT